MSVLRFLFIGGIIIMDWKEWFYYDETSISFLRWKKSNGKTSKDSVAGTIKGQYYFRVQLKQKLYTVHRIIWEILNSEIPAGYEIDHYDLDKTNNKISNLRLVTKQENCRNRPIRSDSSSGINGVKLRTQSDNTGRNYVSWVGRYTLLNGKRVSKSFSVNKYGDDNARQLAIDFVRSFDREKDLYTNQHGEQYGFVPDY